MFEFKIEVIQVHDLNSFCLLGNAFLSSVAFFQNHLFSKIRNTIRVSNSLDPDQARHFVGSDLGPNCF